MDLKQIHEQIKQAEQELAKLVEQEEKQATGKAIMYVFAYEQHYDDVPGEWGPSYQQIEATSVGQAFRILGHLVDEMKLTIRNVHYGYWSDMLEEIDRISDYWHEHHNRKR